MLFLPRSIRPDAAGRITYFNEAAADSGAPGRALGTIGEWCGSWKSCIGRTARRCGTMNAPDGDGLEGENRAVREQSRSHLPERPNGHARVLASLSDAAARRNRQAGRRGGSTCWSTSRSASARKSRAGAILLVRETDITASRTRSPPCRRSWARPPRSSAIDRRNSRHALTGRIGALAKTHLLL